MLTLADLFTYQNYQNNTGRNFSGLTSIFCILAHMGKNETTNNTFKTNPSQYRLVYEENNLVRTTNVSGDLLGGGWHFHQEYELVLNIKSHGTTLIGDHVSTYQENTLYLLGPNLPHTFLCDPGFPTAKAECWVLHFKEEMFSKAFMEQPEFLLLNKMLKKSEFGICFSKETSKQILPLFKKLIRSKGIDRFSLVVKILDICSHQTDYKLAVSENFTSVYISPTDEKMQKIVNYIDHNYHQKITLTEMANIANMQENAFCRYFKRKTNLSLFDYINRVRIGNACKLLLMKDLSIQQICYRTGYNSPSNFINQFRLRTEMSPKEYRSFFSEKLKG